MEKEERRAAAPGDTEGLRQMEYIRRVREKNDAYTEQTGRKRKFYSLAMGCQMNGHDSEKLEGMLAEMGYEQTQKETEADFVIYNTCCIRENAELKVYGKLGALKHYKETQNPDVIIALCGCMTQQPTVLETLQRKYRHVDIVFGTFNLYKLPELTLARMESGEAVYDIWQEQKGIVEDVPSRRSHPYKASVNIMYGCDNFCSYCVVPYVRGRERSRTPEDILAEVRRLAAEGVKEIMLLGQNVNSYGKKLERPVTFAELLRQIDAVEGIERIRFMTSHPKDLSDELIRAMAECDKVCKYLHLPVQSGSSEILRRMNRRYTKEAYLELVRKVREIMPGITLSTDIIVGFPGETEEDFRETLDVIRRARYSAAFTFLYSPRVGTPAAAMENQVLEDVAKERFDRMLDVLNPIVHEVHEEQLGKILEVFVEKTSRQDSGIVSGRADNHMLVHFPGTPECIGKTIPVRITENKTFYLIGERV